MEKAIFLDRDGVINEVLTNRVKFVNKPSEWYLLKGKIKRCRSFLDVVAIDAARK